MDKGLFLIWAFLNSRFNGFRGWYVIDDEVVCMSLVVGLFDSNLSLF